MIIKPEYPDYYDVAVQSDIVAAIDADDRAVYFNLVIERVWDGQDLVTYIRPATSAPICAERPHLSHPARAGARPIGADKWLLACDQAYISGAHIIMTDEILAAYRQEG